MVFSSPASRMPEIMADHCGYSNENHFAARTYWLFNMKNHAELFGHGKGAFTGAVRERNGVFEAVDGGTLFLDEVGELSLVAQVKLLWVLQEKTLTRVDAAQPISVKARIIAATNRQLVTEIREGRFREDLFYRLAVAMLKLPPLREREGDLSLLIERLLEQVNRDGAEDPGYQQKIFLPAREILC